MKEKIPVAWSPFISPLAMMLVISRIAESPEEFILGGVASIVAEQGVEIIGDKALSKVATLMFAFKNQP